MLYCRILPHTAIVYGGRSCKTHASSSLSCFHIAFFLFLFFFFLFHSYPGYDVIKRISQYLNNNHTWLKKKIKSSLHSRYYSEASKEWRIHLRGLAPGQHKNVAAVAIILNLYCDARMIITTQQWNKLTFVHLMQGGLIGRSLSSVLTSPRRTRLYIVSPVT